MIHLRKYNEGTELEPLDNEYIKDCFIEFIDIPSTSVSFVRNIFYIHIDEPKLERNYDSNGTFSIIEYIKSSKIHNEFYLEVENCIDKVKLKYTNYIFNTTVTTRASGPILVIRIHKNND